MVDRRFLFCVSLIGSSFTFLLFSAERETRRSGRPGDLETVAGCDVVQVVGTRAAPGARGARGGGGGGGTLTGRDAHHVSPPTTFHRKTQPSTSPNHSTPSPPKIFHHPETHHYS